MTEKEKYEEEEYKEISIISSLSINNVINITVYDEHTHDISSQHTISINNNHKLDEINKFIDSLSENNPVLLSDEKYECPIKIISDILSDLDTFTKNEMLVITIGGNIRMNELIVYDSSKKQLSPRSADDIKHIIYEDYKLYLACSNIIFRFETFKGEYFYIKMNSAYSDIKINILDDETDKVKFEFATLIKEGREYPFDEVDFITTIDVTRSDMLTIRDVELKSFSGVDPINAGREPTKFIYEGFSVNSL